MNDFNITNKLMPKFNNIQTPEFNTSLNAQISKNVNLSEDKELMQDLNSIMSNSKIDNVSSIENVANSFSNTLGDIITNTNKEHTTAANAIKTFASGGDIDIHSVMIAQEKANMSMQLTMQLRNKLLNAYQEISRMQI